MRTKIILTILLAVVAIAGCSKLNTIKKITEKVQGDKLYFCERYVTKEIGEGDRFKAGKVTVMVKLNSSIGESEVNINITDLASGKAVETYPFTVQPSWDYIHFDDVEFKEAGKYKVSCLKKNGDIIATGEVEII